MAVTVSSTELGRRIRKLRMERRLTLKQVEEQAGLSATHLSEVERGRTSPTIGALIRIARALDRDTCYFIEPEDRDEIAHLRRDDRVRLTPAAGVTAEALTAGIPGHRLFAYLLRFDPGAELTVRASEIGGDAIYIVRAGTLATKAGSEAHELGAGASLHASSSQSHHLRNPGDTPVEVLGILPRALREMAAREP